MHDGRLEKITLPSQQYYLELQDTSVAVIDESTAVVMALKKGKTRVLLHDRNVDEREAGIRLPSATLTVSDPCYLALAIQPHHNWIVMVKGHYEIIVEVYDRWEEFFDIYSGLQCILSSSGVSISTASLSCTTYFFIIPFSFHHVVVYFHILSSSLIL